MVPTFYRAVVNNTCGNIYSSICHCCHPQLLDRSYEYRLEHRHQLVRWAGTIHHLCSDVYIALPSHNRLPVVNAAVPAITHLHILGGATVTINGTGTLTIGGTISEVNPGINHSPQRNDKS